MCILYAKNKNKAIRLVHWEFFLTWPEYFSLFAPLFLGSNHKVVSVDDFATVSQFNGLLRRGIHYLIKSSHFHPNCRINKSISLCRSLLCIWYKNQSFKFSHGNTMDDSYIYKTWVVFSLKNNDLHSSVCKLMFRGKVFAHITNQ